MPDFSLLTKFKPNATIVPIAPFIKKKSSQEFRIGTVVAFDQALANTGYVICEIADDKPFVVTEMGTLHTTTTDGRTAWDDNFYRTCELESAVSLLLDEKSPDLVLCEMPPVGQSGKMRRTESSILAASAIWSARWPLPVEMVAARKVKKHLTDNPSASKTEVRQALEERFGDALDNSLFHKNEHTFDALGIAVTYLED